MQKNNVPRTRTFYRNVISKAFSLPYPLSFMALDVVEYVPTFGAENLNLESLAGRLCCSSGEVRLCLQRMREEEILPDEFLPLLGTTGDSQSCGVQI